MHRYPLPPSANRYWRYAGGKIYVSDEAKNYRDTFKMLARVDGVTQMSGPVAVTIAVYRERKAGDLDNFVKCLLDSMQGVFFANDSQVVKLVATRHDDRHDPRVEVEVTSCRPYVEKASNKP